jgi:NAD(P)-dependent dehydrogenase (short-subunit alcohol dehydrogenase family)
VALAEWLAIEYADAGIRVSCICPQGVRTPMLELAMQEPTAAAALTAGGLIEPEDVADAVVAGMREERMLILPHENVAGFMALKGSDHERWLKGMRRLVRNARAPAPG